MWAQTDMNIPRILYKLGLSEGWAHNTLDLVPWLPGSDYSTGPAPSQAGDEPRFIFITLQSDPWIEK